MKKILLFALNILSLTAFAQQPQLLQERSYKVSANEKELKRSAFDKQGNILYSGSSLASTNNFSSYFLKVKPNTDTVWTRNGPIDLYHSMQVLKATPDGGFIFCGSLKHPNTSAVSGLLMQKRDSMGYPVWTNNNYYNNTLNLPTTLLVMPDKGFLIGGLINSKGSSLLRTDSLGNTKWLKDYTQSSWDAISQLQFTTNNKIVAYGATDVPIGPGHPRLTLLNQNGDSLKGQQVIVVNTNRLESLYTTWNNILPLSDGGYLFTGHIDTTSSVVPGSQSMSMVVKVDSSFNLKWNYVHRTPTNPVEQYVFTQAKELTDGTVLVLGFKFRPFTGASLNEFQLYRFNPTGQLKNVYPFTSSICSQVWGITFDALADSTFMIGGRCGNNPPVSFGFYVAKVKIPGLPPVVPPFTITGTKEETLLAGMSLGQSYPNPTAAEAVIPYSLPKNYSKASIMIREISTGREIRKYELKLNSNSLTVDVSNLSNGLYLYSLEVDDKPVATKKLAVMK